MGTINSAPSRLASYQPGDTYPNGLDLTRCEIVRAAGHYKAASSGSFRQGTGVMLNSSREVVAFDANAASTFLGVAKWDKVTATQSIVVDERVVFGTALATKTLAHPLLVSGSVVVRSATAFGGTTYTVTTHYTVDHTAGTISHVGTIDVTLPVYVTYVWTLSTEDLYLLDGVNFWNTPDYATVQDGRITVIKAPSVIFTSEWDTAVSYAYTGATSNIYCNSNGIFSSSSSSAKLVGKVEQLPTAADPYLGIELIGQVAANT